MMVVDVVVDRVVVVDIHQTVVHLRIHIAVVVDILHHHHLLDMVLLVLGLDNLLGTVVVHLHLLGMAVVVDGFDLDRMDRSRHFHIQVVVVAYLHILHSHRMADSDNLNLISNMIIVLT
ncbi:hypothetical protein GCK72_010495 [Caenorhabditis remanei]|uniref:Uncharacterized protein n=1 Tax=Caenorhabditis remanei TaxID=31234 RepID=A0A6A5H6T3_CAERE|nr:hypothetical protein GCK72_010495 [Caenorhabditis remanei]KAF1762233.1 hypothetical protein GCK72_010495 [Caenorhabditis remanei]